jgi:hypothetical protein
MLGFLLLCLLALLAGGCRSSGIDSFGDRTIVRDDFQTFYAAMELSCTHCDPEDEIVLTISYGFASLERLGSFSIQIETSDFVVSESAVWSMTSVDPSFVISQNRRVIVYPKSIRVNLHRLTSEFAIDNLRVRFSRLGEDGEDLKIIDATYAMDELGVLFDGSTKSVLQTSLNRIYEKGWIDDAEYVRRECLSIYQNQRLIHAGYRNELDLYLVYASANLRARMILPLTHPLAVQYLELEAAYQAGIADHSSLTADWKKEELHALAEGILHLLREKGSIDETTWEDETLHLADETVILREPEQPEQSALFFKAEFGPLYFNGGDDVNR